MEHLLPKYLPIEEYMKLPREERFSRYIKLSKNDEDRAAELHEKMIVVDMHEHTTAYLVPGGLDGWPEFPRDLICESGVTCFIELGVGRLDYLRAVRDLGVRFSVIDLNKDMTCRVFRAEDVRRAKKEGKVGFLCGLEEEAMGGMLDRADIFYGLGVRSMGLTYFTRNTIGDGSMERTDCGLSYYGLQVIDRMNKLGMIIDLSHAGHATTLEAIETSREPCTCNHAVTNLYPHTMPYDRRKTGILTPYHQAKTDEEIKALAEKGGVIAIFATSGGPLSRRNRQSIHDYLDHIDQAVKAGGVDCVGIGLDSITGYKIRALAQKIEAAARERVDGRVLYGPLPPWTIPEHARYYRFDGFPFTEYVEGLNGFLEIPNITRGLIYRGYSDKEIEKIMGGNALRIIEKVIG